MTTTSLIKSHPGFNDPNYRWSISDFDIGRKLGSGQFGQVFFVREKYTRMAFALKVVDKRRLLENNCHVQICREIEIHSRLHHKNIIKLVKFFHDSDRIYMVLEMAFKGELYKFMNSFEKGAFPEHLAAKFVYQISDAIVYMHSKHVIHRDIKPENILIDSNENAKLADFGWSVHSVNHLRDTICGTLDYLAPELIEKTPYDPNVDLWCIGVLCYELIVGSPPFEDNSDSKTQELIAKGDVHYPDTMNKKCRDLVSKLLVKNPSARLDLRSVQKHPWIKETMKKASY